MLRGILRKVWSAVWVDILSEYARNFLDLITFENFRRFIIGGAVIALIEIGFFFSRAGAE